ncbi:MAG: GldG family protein [Myxococcota bacterium]
MKTFGKIAGGLGLLLTLTSFITLFIVSGPVVFFVKLGLGLALLAVWGVTNGRSIATWSRSAFFFSSSAVIAVVFLGLLVAANFIAARRAPTWDLTRKKIFSLSPQTEQTMKALKDPVKVLVFIEGGGAAPALEDLFRRYQALNDKLTWEVKDPRKANDLVQKYQIRTGQVSAVLVKSPDSSTESHTPLNLARLGSPQLAEQELTNALIKLNTVGTQKLYFTQGHGEWPLEPQGQGEEAVLASLAAVNRVLQDEGYAPEKLNLIERGEVPRDASALVICGARSKFTEPEKKAVADFLEQGGRVVYLAEVGAEPGLDAILAKYGVQVDPGLVADEKTNRDNPFVVITPFFAEHEITRPFTKAAANLVFPTVRSLTVLTQGLLDGVTPLPLITTSPAAWLETSLSENPTLDAGEKSGQLPLVIVATRNTASVANKRSDEARLIVFGDSEAMVGAFGYEPDRNLVMNAIAWATLQTQKITIRPPDRDISTIDLTPDLLSTIRLLSMDVLPLLLIGVGLTIWLTRRAR